MKPQLGKRELHHIARLETPPICRLKSQIDQLFCGSSRLEGVKKATTIYKSIV